MTAAGLTLRKGGDVPLPRETSHSLFPCTGDTTGRPGTVASQQGSWAGLHYLRYTVLGSGVSSVLSQLNHMHAS